MYVFSFICDANAAPIRRKRANQAIAECTSEKITWQQLELSLQIYQLINNEHLTFGFSSDIATVFAERAFGKLVRLTLSAFLPPLVLSSPPLTGTCLELPLQMNDWF